VLSLLLNQEFCTYAPSGGSGSFPAITEESNMDQSFFFSANELSSSGGSAKKFNRWRKARLSSATQEQGVDSRLGRWPSARACVRATWINNLPGQSEACSALTSYTVEPRRLTGAIRPSLDRTNWRKRPLLFCGTCVCVFLSRKTSGKKCTAHNTIDGNVHACFMLGRNWMMETYPVVWTSPGGTT
jgi:hypothetical protein